MEPVRPSVDRRLYQFMAGTTLRVSDFFETRQGVCKVMPELTSKIIPLVRSLDPEINRVVKDFASFFKTRLVQARPDNKQKIGSWIKKAEPELSTFPLPDLNKFPEQGRLHKLVGVRKTGTRPYATMPWCSEAAAWALVGRSYGRDEATVISQGADLID